MWRVATVPCGWGPLPNSQASAMEMRSVPFGNTEIHICRCRVASSCRFVLVFEVEVRSHIMVQRTHYLGSITVQKMSNMFIHGSTRRARTHTTCSTTSESGSRLRPVVPARCLPLHYSTGSRRLGRVSPPTQRQRRNTPPLAARPPPLRHVQFVTVLAIRDTPRRARKQPQRACARPTRRTISHWPRYRCGSLVRLTFAL